MLEQAWMLLAHSSRKKHHNNVVSYNLRMDTQQCTSLSVKLPLVEGYNQTRWDIAQRYNNWLKGLDGIITPQLSQGHFFHQYTVCILHEWQDTVQVRLAQLGVGIMVYYTVPLQKLPIYADFGQHLSESEQAVAEVVSLPICPQLSVETQERVV